MELELSDLLLGIYLPIIVLAAKSVIRLSISVYRATKKDRFTLEQHSIALAAGFALSAHLYEACYYGLARWVPSLYDTIGRSVLGVGFGKILILFACVFALVSVWSWGSAKLRLVVAILIALSLWSIATFVALLYV
jgi:hypothetical protein